MIIKEMYSAPAAACARVDPLQKLLPDQDGAAIMVRDRKASHDGWFWGWYGWTGCGRRTGRPPPPTPMPSMGFGQYCTNCHASAKDNSTFAALKNIKGEPGEPLVFLSQNFFLDPSLAKPAQPSSLQVDSQGRRRSAGADRYNDGLHQDLRGLRVARSAAGASRS